MKKLIALIACISVFACMSVSALAATPTASTESISYTEATETASGYFTIDASSVATGNTQTTIVVIDGVATEETDAETGETVKKYNISTDTIQYINQQESTSFTVIPTSHDTYLEGAAATTLTVLIGGDAINKTELGTISYAAAEVQTYTVTFYDEDGTVLQTATYESGATLTAPTNLKTEDDDYTYEFAGWMDKNSASSSTVELPATVTANAEYVAVYNKTEKEVSGGEDTDFTYGDVDGNGTINATDAGWILTKYGIPTTVFPCNADEAGDVDGNGTINATDAGWILTKYGIPTTVFPAESK